MSRKLTFAMFIDAFGWEVLKMNRFMEGVLPHRKKLNTIFGYSCTAIPTILTGLNPDVHKHFSFFFHSKNSPFKPLKPLSLIPECIAGRGRVRSKMSNIIRRLYGYTGYFQLYNVPFQYLDQFDYCEKVDMYKEGAMAPHTTIFDSMKANGIPYYVSDWRKSEKYNIGEMEQVLEKGEVSLAYLYTAAMDSLLHCKGKEHPLIAKKVAFYEERLKRLIDIAHGSYDEVDILVFSDHGMNTIHTTVDLMSEIEKTGARFGKDFVSVYDSTMARFWFKKDHCASRISSVLKSLDYGRILTQEELKRWGCWFDDSQYGELFFLLNPGVLMVPSHMGKTPLKGMHGYAPDSPDAFAMIMSNKEIPQGLSGLSHIRGHIESLVNVHKSVTSQKDETVAERRAA